MNSGVPGSMPSSWSKGISVWPKRSKFSCVSQTSETRKASVGPKATAKSRPLGEPSPAASRRLMTSSYCCDDNDGGVKRTTKAMDWFPLLVVDWKYVASVRLDLSIGVECHESLNGFAAHL